jgi:hypothetical protein
MIVKEMSSESPTDKFGQAGYEAEKQMAFYLRRAFGESDDVFVFNDLRLVRDGEVAQIDHLVLHRFGLALVESKSICGTIEVNRQLEFVRTYGRNRTGMKSPITQVTMQKELLQALLNDHNQQLLRKVIFGKVQTKFTDWRFQTLVAISDQGEIKRRNCDPPELVKADRVATRIQETINLHEQAIGLGGIMRQFLSDKKTAKKLTDADMPPFTQDEMRGVCDFLLQQQTYDAKPVEASPATNQPPIVFLDSPSDSSNSVNCCRHCNSQELKVVYGKYGYYFKCLSCQGNTPIDLKCTSCGQKARVRKKGVDFDRVCAACGSEAYFFTNPI